MSVKYPVIYNNSSRKDSHFRTDYELCRSKRTVKSRKTSLRLLERKFDLNCVGLSVYKFKVITSIDLKTIFKFYIQFGKIILRRESVWKKKLSTKRRRKFQYEVVSTITYTDWFVQSIYYSTDLFSIYIFYIEKKMNVIGKSLILPFDYW